jgi:hypothetical protein
MVKKTVETTAPFLARLDVATVKFHIVGVSPLVMHRQSEKARRELLQASVKKSKVDRAAESKHDPVAEFRAAIYRNRTDDTPTACHMPGGAFKRSMAEAALRIPGGNKTEVGQLTHVVDESVYIYGVPFMFSQWIREGMSKTPNVRFVPIFPEWACTVEVLYTPPIINDEIIFNLLVGAGHIMGIGDGRPQKGKFSRGRFAPVPEKDPTFQRIVKTGGRAAQLKAIENAEPFDAECRELTEWFYGEADRRRFPYTAPGSTWEVRT